MKKLTRIRDMVLGALVAALLFSLASPVLAALIPKTVDVVTGVKVYVNDLLVDPKNVNGESVEVLAYNGTTYLPIRAVGNALGLAVQYDAATQSAYLGQHKSQAPAFYLDEFDYFSGTDDKNFETKLNVDDNLRQGHSHCIVKNFERTYKLNGQYSRLTGNLFQEYEKRAEMFYAGNSGLHIYADERLVYAKEFDDRTTGLEPQIIDLDLTGVLELKITFSDGGNAFSPDGPLALGEMALYT